LSRTGDGGDEGPEPYMNVYKIDLETFEMRDVFDSHYTAGELLDKK